MGQDNFNRANNTTLGSGWTDVTGSWGIDNFLINPVAYLEPTGGRAIFNMDHVVPDGSMYIYYKIISEDFLPTEITYLIYINWVDANNHFIAKFFDKAVNPKIELWSVSGGVATLLASDIIDGMTAPAPRPDGDGWERTFYAMIAEKEFCAFVQYAVLSIVIDDPGFNGTGYRGGMGAEDMVSLNAYFDDYVFSQHAETDATCPACICQCEGNYIPPILYAHITGTGRADPELDCTITLVWDRLNGYWYGEGACCSGSLVVDWKLALSCPDDGEATGFKIDVLQGCINSDTPPTGLDPGQRFASEGSTCGAPPSVPLYLIFEGFFIGSSDLACPCGTPFTGNGGYFIEITETP